MTGDVILAELRTGPRTTSELMEATGVSRNAVNCALYTLGATGYTIVNETPLGGCADGFYRLAFDREHPTHRSCEWPGCSISLNRYNPGPYCLGHRRGVARLMLACIDDRLAREEEVVVEHEQLALVR